MPPAASEVENPTPNSPSLPLAAARLAILTDDEVRSAVLHARQDLKLVALTSWVTRSWRCSLVSYRGVSAPIPAIASSPPAAGGRPVTVPSPPAAVPRPGPAPGSAPSRPAAGGGPGPAPSRPAAGGRPALASARTRRIRYCQPAARTHAHACTAWP